MRAPVFRESIDYKDSSDSMEYIAVMSEPTSETEEELKHRERVRRIIDEDREILDSLA